MFVIIQSSAFLPTPAQGAGAVEYLVAKLALALAETNRIGLLCLEGSKVEHSKVTLWQVEAKGSAVAREGAMASFVGKSFGELMGTEGGRGMVLFDHSLHQLTQRRHPKLKVVTMSHGMAPLSPWARNPVFTSVHHGRLHGVTEPKALHNAIDMAEVPFGSADQRDDVLLWAGRIMRYKQPHIAVDIARAAGMKLLLCGPVIERDYAEEIRADEHVVLLGEVHHETVLQLLGKARALLFTSDDTEPAGIIMLEAQAAGTPVLAFDHGAVREFTLPETRFLAHEKLDMVEAVEKKFWTDIDPFACRKAVEDHWSIGVMAAAAEGYLREAVEGATW